MFTFATLDQIDDRLGVRRGCGRRFASPGSACPPNPPVAWRGGLRIQDSKSAAGRPSSERGRGLLGAGVGGAGLVRGGGVGGVFSPRPGTGGNQEPAGRSSGGGLSLC